MNCIGNTSLGSKIVEMTDVELEVKISALRQAVKK